MLQTVIQGVAMSIERYPGSEVEHINLGVQVQRGRERVVQVTRQWRGMPYGAGWQAGVGSYAWTCPRHGATDCAHVQAARDYVETHTDELARAVQVERDAEAKALAELERRYGDLID